MTKHSYNKEFKEQAVQYYLDNKDHMTMNEISKNLGIGASTLHKWIKLFTETGSLAVALVILPAIRTRRLHD